MPDLRSRFPTTSALLCAIDLCPPHIELEDVPSLKRAPPGLHAAELEHWLLSYGFWAKTREPRFIAKRIEHMTDEEFRWWCLASREAKRAWYRWLLGE